jgi:hypothetical protein
MELKKLSVSVLLAGTLGVIMILLSAGDGVAQLREYFGGSIPPEYQGQPGMRQEWPSDSQGTQNPSSFGSLPPSTPAPSAGPGQTLLDTWNTGNVGNGPTGQDTFGINQPCLITSIINYHWNYGRGQAGGTIGLRAGNGQFYGPWQVRSTSGQGGAQNVTWTVNPNVLIPPGTYTVVDSNPATWSQNPQSGGRGFSRVIGQLQAPASPNYSGYVTPKVTPQPGTQTGAGSTYNPQTPAKKDQSLNAAEQFMKTYEAQQGTGKK